MQAAQHFYIRIPPFLLSTTRSLLNIQDTVQIPLCHEVPLDWQFHSKYFLLWSPREFTTNTLAAVFMLVTVPLATHSQGQVEEAAQGSSFITNHSSSPTPTVYLPTGHCWAKKLRLNEVWIISKQILSHEFELEFWKTEGREEDREKNTPNSHITLMVKHLCTTLQQLLESRTGLQYLSSYVDTAWIFILELHEI